MNKGVKIMFAISISLIIKILEWIPLYKAGKDFKQAFIKDYACNTANIAY